MSSPAAPALAVGDPAADALRRSALRRMRTVAVSLLLFAAAVYVLTLDEEGWLGGVGGLELVRRALEAEPAERHSEGGVGCLEDGPRRREGLCEILPHSRLLGALARKQQDDVHGQNRTIIDAQVNPAPNATRRTVDPSRTRPAWIASSSAMGIDAEEVLP